MGYKGIIRAVQADIRRSQREAVRRQRELERRQKEYAKMQELARAKFEVERYENQIEVLLSVHKECGPAWDWQKIKNSSPPKEPTLRYPKGIIAKRKLDNFKPGFFTKLFGLTEKKLTKLEEAVNAAKIEDETVYKNELKQYEEDYKSWKEIRDMAEKICAGDMEAYCEAVKEINPFYNGPHKLDRKLSFF